MPKTIAMLKPGRVSGREMGVWGRLLGQKPYHEVAHFGQFAQHTEGNHTVLASEVNEASKFVSV